MTTELEQKIWKQNQRKYLLTHCKDKAWSNNKTDDEFNRGWACAMTFAVAIINGDMDDKFECLQ